MDGVREGRDHSGEAVARLRSELEHCGRHVLSCSSTRPGSCRVSEGAVELAKQEHEATGENGSHAVWITILSQRSGLQERDAVDVRVNKLLQLCCCLPDLLRYPEKGINVLTCELW